MIKDEEFYEELKSLIDNFNLTDEEIEGYVEFQNKHKIKNKKILNSGSKKDDIT